MTKKPSKPQSELERFTDQKGRKKSMVSSADAYQRLAEYENTGLSPDMVLQLKNTCGRPL